jgi:uncharacterized glyoxalase superfamily protein PhnB
VAVKPVPEGFHTLTPYLVVPGVARLIDFLKEAFNAEELHRSARPDGTIMHAQVKVGDSMLMMGEPAGEWKAMPASLYMYVPDVDAIYRRAIGAGGKSLSEPADQFYGDRHAGLTDPSGNMWWIATHKEDVAPDELERRAQAAMAKRGTS